MKKLKSKSEAKQRDQALQKKKPEVAKPLSMAEEMRMKLVRRQKLLSGARDDEEQAAARERKKRMSAGVNVVSFVGKLKSGLAQKTVRRVREPRSEWRTRLQAKARGPFSMKGMSGLDAKLQHLAAAIDLAPTPQTTTAKTTGEARYYLFQHVKSVFLAYLCTVMPRAHV